MAYKCLECGHIFEDGEQVTWQENHGFADGPYESFSGCPVCRGDYDKTFPCKVCGSEVWEEEIYDGFCLHCLKEAVTQEIGISYIKDRKMMKSFVFFSIFDVEEPITTSESLEEWCEFIARQSASVKQLTEYIVDSDELNALDFANWLNAMEVKK